LSAGLDRVGRTVVRCDGHAVLVKTYDAADLMAALKRAVARASTHNARVATERPDA